MNVLHDEVLFGTGDDEPEPICILWTQKLDIYDIALGLNYTQPHQTNYDTVESMILPSLWVRLQVY